jgi:hypothetical protein
LLTVGATLVRAQGDRGYRPARSTLNQEAADAVTGELHQKGHEAMAAYLVSDGAGYVTGGVIGVDGGRTT